MLGVLAMLAVFGAEQNVAPDKPRVEAMIDRGPIYELVVRCAQGTAIVSASKLNRTYCTPALHCDTDLARVLARACR